MRLYIPCYLVTHHTHPCLSQNIALLPEINCLMHRFFLHPDTFHCSSIILEGSAAHHCVNTLRLQLGEQIIIFNGCGEEAVATIAHIKKDQVMLTAPMNYRFTPRPTTEITLAQAMLKAKNMDWIIQKAVELGTTCIAPLIAERTVVQIDGEVAGYRRQSKWEGIAVEACKQCGQNWLPHILPPVHFKTFIQSAGTEENFLLIASLQSDACRFKDVLASYHQKFHKSPRRITVFVGPEGDFTPEEITLAKRNGCQPITLGSIILRAETAALYCLSILSYELYL